MDAFAAVLAGVTGLCFGSFANVVVHRVPRRESLVSPPSRCPSCGHTLGILENIPVVSYLVQRGRCRACGTGISPRYPAAEILTALLWILAVVQLGLGWTLLAYLPFLWMLVALSLIDLEHKLLPNRIVYPALVASPILLAVTAAVGPGFDVWVRAMAAGVISGAVFFVIALISPAGMGMGDVKLSVVLGMYLGYLGWSTVVTGFFLAFLIGAVAGIGLMVAGRAGRKSAIPFGPFLALGTVIAILFAEDLPQLWLV